MPEVQVQQSSPIQTPPTYNVEPVVTSQNMASEISSQPPLPSIEQGNEPSISPGAQSAESVNSASNNISADPASRQEDDSDVDQAPTPPSDAQSVVGEETQSNGQLVEENATTTQTLRAENPLSNSVQIDGEASPGNGSTVPSTNILASSNRVLEDPVHSSPPHDGRVSHSESASPSRDAAMPSEDSVSPQEDTGVPTDSAPNAPSEESSPPPETDATPPEISADEEAPKVEEESKEKAFWVDLKEDTSTPDENEVKEIEESGHEHSAHNFDYFEDQFYSEEDDPEFRPSKKIRLTWILKGIRGTKDRPNYARVINSPAAKVGDFYWRLKFFPRGNNSRSLSCYIKCSKSPGDDDEEVLETKFRWLEGPGDGLLGNIEPRGVVNFPATPPKIEKRADNVDSTVPKESAEKHEEGVKGEAQPSLESAVNAEKIGSEDDGWRVPAQIGVVIYNPEEPRTNHYNSSCHQFNKGNDDWGWTNFQPEGWDEIHTRQRFQRQALLRNDTLAFDAYIRVFEDPTQRLWFHTSESESFWDGLSVTGYRAFGTPPLRHSPGVAGLASLMHLAPFRKIIQAIQIDEWRHDNKARPRPISTAAQAVLYLMRKQRKRQEYVDVYRILDLMIDLGEKFQDVLTFWERFRRSIELEVQDQELMNQMSQIFDIQPRDNGAAIQKDPLSRQQATLQISCADVSSISEGLCKLEPSDYNDKMLPEFLTVDLNRQKFDVDSRAWKLRYNRVRLDEELDLRGLVPHQPTAKYTLYGFIVHCGDRNSGHFYSVLRPDGPGTRWLAFEDGDGNKILIQTRKMLDEFEGLESPALEENSSTRQTVYVAMYIRTDLVENYLPGKIEPWDIPPWLKLPKYVRDNLDEKDAAEPEKQEETDITLDLYSTEHIQGRLGMLDVHALKSVQSGDDHVTTMTVPFATTYYELRHRLAELKKIDNVQRVRFWKLGYNAPLDGLNNTVARIIDYGESVGKSALLSRCCLWFVVLEESDINLFGMPEPRSKEQDVLNEQPPEQRSASGNEENREAPRDTEASDTTVNSVTNPAEELANVPMDHSASEQPENLNTTQERPSEEPPVPEINGENRERRESRTAPGTATYATLENDPLANGDHRRTTPPAQEEAGNANANAEPLTEAQLNEAAIAAMVAEEVAAFDAATDNNQGDIPHPVHATPPVQTHETSNANPSSDSATARTADTNHSEAANELGVARVVATDEAQNAATTAPESDQQGSVSPADENSNHANDAADVHSDTSSEAEEELGLQPHTYKFLQVFDAHKQEVKTIRSLFAKKDAPIKEVIRSVLGWANDKNFHMWWLEPPYRTRNISPEAVFDNCDSHSDSSVILVGEILSESEYVIPLLGPNS